MLESERTLPVHPQMIELGLLKLVEMRRREGRIRLFPHLRRGMQKGTFSANFTKCFGYYRRTNGRYWTGLEFPALRRASHNDLLSVDKSDALRCRLMGHVRTDEGDQSYSQGLGIGALVDRMRSIMVDVSMIRKPFDDHPSLARAPDGARGLRPVGSAVDCRDAVSRALRYPWTPCPTARRRLKMKTRGPPHWVDRDRNCLPWKGANLRRFRPTGVLVVAHGPADRAAINWVGLPDAAIRSRTETTQRWQR